MEHLVKCRTVTTEDGEHYFFFTEGLQDSGCSGQFASFLIHAMPRRFKKVYTPTKSLICNRDGLRWLNERIIHQLYRENYFMARSKLIELSIEHQIDGLESIDVDDSSLIHEITSRIMGCTYKDITGHEPNDFDMVLTFKSSGELKLIDERIQEWPEQNFKPLTAIQ